MASGYQSQLGFWQPWGVGGFSIQAGYHSQLGFWQPWGVGGITSAPFSPAWAINSNVVLQHGKPI